MDQHEDLWHVQLESGEVRILTLDQLDAFYQNGIIDEETYVLRDGTMAWIKLGEALGASEPAAAAPAPAVVPSPAPVKSFSPFVQSSPFAPAPTVLQSYGSVPPYPRSTPQPSPFETPFETPYQTHASTRPVVSEIDPGELDLDALPFKKSNKGKYILAAGTVGLVAFMVAVLGANRIGRSASESSVAAAVVNAAPTQPAPTVTIPPPPPVDPQPVALKDDVKKALADKDNQLNQKMAQRKEARAKYVPPTHSKPSAPPFRKGGNAYDPLNAKL